MCGRFVAIIPYEELKAIYEHITLGMMFFIHQQVSRKLHSAHP